MPAQCQIQYYHSESSLQLLFSEFHQRLMAWASMCLMAPDFVVPPCSSQIHDCFSTYLWSLEYLVVAAEPVCRSGAMLVFLSGTRPSVEDSLLIHSWQKFANTSSTISMCLVQVHVGLILTGRITTLRVNPRAEIGNAPGSFHRHQIGKQDGH